MAHRCCLPHDKGIIDEVNKVKVEDVKFRKAQSLYRLSVRKSTSSTLEKIKP